MKEVEALLGDLEAKIEELKTTPTPTDMVTQGLDHLLGTWAQSSASASASGSGAGADTAPVNDLTSMVRKKPAKKAVQPVPAAASANGGGSGTGTGDGEAKRKAEEEANGNTEKKAKAE